MDATPPEGIPGIPAPRAEDDALPQRTRGRTVRPAPVDEPTDPDDEPARDPSGRPLAATDGHTLDRVLSGLRRI